MIAVYIGTNNDTNGNPRRGWILFGEESGLFIDPVGFVDEGYEGIAALRVHKNVASTPLIHVTPAEYRKWKKRRVIKNRGRKRTSRPRRNKRTSRRAR